MGVIEHTISSSVAQRADELLADRRVRLATWHGGVVAGAVILGRTDDYEVYFSPDGVQCTCRAGSDHGWTEPRCSHAVAAMVAWHEHMLAAEALS